MLQIKVTPERWSCVSLGLLFTDVLRSPYAEHNVDGTTLSVVQEIWARYPPLCFDKDYLSQVLSKRVVYQNDEYLSSH